MNSTSFASSLTASRDATGNQTYPPGALYIAATPIGNLGDITLRALNVFQIADVIACEDTRHTQHLLHAYGLHLEAAKFVAVHQHNEAEAAIKIVSLLQSGRRVVYVSDAGTPGVSDPGARLVDAARASGARVIPIPGVSSITALLSVAGITGHAGFLFVGFLSSKSVERARVLDTLVTRNETLVLLESPHRIESLSLQLSELCADRDVTVGRELTKRYEEVVTLPAGELPRWLRGEVAELEQQEQGGETDQGVKPAESDPKPLAPAEGGAGLGVDIRATVTAPALPAQTSRCRGEFVLVLHARRATSPRSSDPINANESYTDRLLQALLRELPLKTAVSIALEAQGGHGSRKDIYRRALELQRTTQAEDHVKPAS